MRRLLLLGACLGLAFAQPARAWWNGDWSQRARLTLDAGANGADLKSPLSQFPVLVRLHSGNFDFTKAKLDGSDLRFVSGDDKTPLKHSIEKWDPESGLALVWLLAPTLAPQAPSALWLYYGNAKAPSVDDAKGVLDPQHVAVFHFAENQGAARDATGYGNNASNSPPARSAASIVGAGARFDGREGIAVPPSPSLRFSASAGVTLSAWVKPDGEGRGTLIAVGDKDRRIALELDAGALAASVEGGGRAQRARGGTLSPGVWHHVALVAGKRLVLYLDGVEAAEAVVEIPDIAGPLQIGRGYAGEMDEAAISATARSADWIRAAAKGQGPDALLVSVGEPEAGSSGSSSYIGVLLGAVTVDGWVVIMILGLMMVISVWVMAAKTMYVNRNERENHVFLGVFHRDAALLDHPARFRDSSLSHVYRAGADQVKARINGQAEKARLSPKAVESIRAALDAARVREGQKLNRFMVLLTIAIAGGPFLGLLGTVIGVMITFAAIAATGDVNVTAIAPGIAAALVATVAGLVVAIPSLFGYNYIGTRIKNISADMQVFADEFLARVAERYEA